jgi:hypothetical protein
MSVVEPDFEYIDEDAVDEELNMLAEIQNATVFVSSFADVNTRVVLNMLAEIQNPTVLKVVGHNDEINCWFHYALR